MTKKFMRALAVGNAMPRRRACILLLVFMQAYSSVTAKMTFAANELADLTLEQLSNIVVTSVSRREQPLGSAAASIYVINAEDIRRAGVNSLPEALRLAPNLQVARTDANQYAISTRGFNNPTANRMLVMIDGRTVYSPLFSGVFWDVQDMMLEDIERIEVISGPGATLWGANAVNGVINVITRRAGDTPGGLLAYGAGNRLDGGVARYGGKFGGDGHFRVYGKFFERNHTDRANGSPVRDASERGQAGFRTDWGDTHGGFTVQGDTYRVNIDQDIGGSRDLFGANLLARWTEQRADGSSLRVQTYYDRAERDQPGSFHKILDILDLEFQHGLLPAKDHWLLWGGGYRYGHDNLEDQNLAAFAFVPEDKELHWYHLFIQDEWDLRSNLALTAGIKGEHNDYTGLEWLPNLRLAWALPKDQLVWGAVSRAVRAPSRLDKELFLPGTPPYILAGGPNFRSEIARVIELGYRLQPASAYSLSITAFHHQHDRVRSYDPTTGFLENKIEGDSYGLEAWGNYRVTPTWNLNAGWTELRRDLRTTTANSTITPSSALLGNDPQRWITLRSTMEITPKHEFDITARYVGALPSPRVAAYTAVDARLGWQARKDMQLSLLVQNLFDPAHPEWGTAANPVEYPRSLFVEAIWRP